MSTSRLAAQYPSMNVRVVARPRSKRIIIFAMFANDAGHFRRI